MFIVFSERHRVARSKGKIRVKIPTGKIRWKILRSMDEWCDYLYNQVRDEFLKSVGYDHLKVPRYGGRMVNVSSIRDFITKISPQFSVHILDIIELCNHFILDPNQQRDFQKEINEIFKLEKQPYRIVGKHIVVLDSDFLESEVLSRAYELLEEHEFEKALRDFANARYNFTSGDWSGVIVECNNAIESTLKKITGKNKARQKQLRNALTKGGLIPEYFQGFCDYFEGLLQSCFNITNKQRHGQKELPDPKDDVDPALASFVLHLTGTLLVFIMERYTEQQEKFNGERQGA